VLVGDEDHGGRPASVGPQASEEIQAIPAVEPRIEEAAHVVVATQRDEGVVEGGCARGSVAETFERGLKPTLDGGVRLHDEDRTFFHRVTGWGRHMDEERDVQPECHAETS
jgi:hypothetical protein